MNGPVDTTVSSEDGECLQMQGMNRQRDQSRYIRRKSYVGPFWRHMRCRGPFAFGIVEQQQEGDSRNDEIDQPSQTRGRLALDLNPDITL